MRAVDPDRILEGLNEEQRRAAEAVRGPVCILAGAGTGKTTTITRRTAFQVASGVFEPGQILCVTFTDKAAGEMRSRLDALGVPGIRARTFHATALAQLRHLVPDTGDILPSKGLWLRQIANTLPKPFRFRPVADLATEIEWARARRVDPASYVAALNGHEPPIPPDLMERVFRAYELRKRREGRIDFDDVLELLVRFYEEHPEAAMRFRMRCRAITVDEYQDVNLLQQSLLDLWLGDRDELCVVGDDYQAIYGFTGATPRYLLDVPRRFPHASVIRLERNYRSTPEVLALANRLVPRLGGAAKNLEPTVAAGDEPITRRCSDARGEAAYVAARARELHEMHGVPWEEIAVLYRVNFRSEDYEESLAEAGIPFQVTGGSFLGRPPARRLLQVLDGSSTSSVSAFVAQEAVRQGLVDVIPDGLGAEETTRQHDLARLVQLAAEFDDGERSAREFAADLRARFASDGQGRGVQLLTLHRAKGLEFEAVFLPRLEEGELPWKRAIAPDALAEERRLLYVGMTRAKRYLHLTWSESPSRFLAELGVGGEARPVVRRRRAERVDDGPALRALKEWRRERAKHDAVPAYVVFHDATLEQLAESLPRSWEDLRDIQGIGPIKVARYGNDVVRVLARFGR